MNQQVTRILSDSVGCKKSVDASDSVHYSDIVLLRLFITNEADLKMLSWHEYLNAIIRKYRNSLPTL